MIQVIFPTSFFAHIVPSNKNELLRACKYVKIDKKKEQPDWVRGCRLRVDNLEYEKLAEVLRPSISAALKDLEIDPSSNFEMTGLWRNTYYEGDYQEIHDHVVDTDVVRGLGLSAVLFLEDYDPDGGGGFFFYNANQIARIYGNILGNASSRSYLLTPNAGEIVFFPSYMLHGVSPHRSKRPRTTISFNLRIV